MEKGLTQVVNPFPRIDLVEQTGFEPATYTLRTCRSPS